MDVEMELKKALALDEPADRAEALSRLLAESHRVTDEVRRARDQVVLDLHQAGVPSVKIVEMLGVTKGRVSQIIHGKRSPR